MQKYIELLLMFVKAFAVGGSICVVAQIVINFTKLTSGRILVFFMLAGVALEGLGLYGKLVDFAGAGATVPISGFGYLLAHGAMHGAERGLFGALTGALSAASGATSLPRASSPGARSWVCSARCCASAALASTTRRGGPTPSRRCSRWLPTPCS